MVYGIRLYMGEFVGKHLFIVIVILVESFHPIQELR